MAKRRLDIVVISDVHLGTYGCRAQELLVYLNSIRPEHLILNGDFIDVWQPKKKQLPQLHTLIIQHIFKLAQEGTKVYYITGNHDDWLRQYADFSAGNIHLRNQLSLRLKDKEYWIFHGDVFDLSVQYAPLKTKFSSKGYDYSIKLNRFVNNFRTKLGKSKMSLSKFIKSRVGEAEKFVADFEDKAMALAAEQGYDYVICGHIHQPQMKAKAIAGKQVIYLNSGDWMENLTALEYQWGNWSIYRYDENDYEPDEKIVQAVKEEEQIEISAALAQIKEEINALTMDTAKAYPQSDKTV